MNSCLRGQDYGGYRITVITPVCGTGYLGSIPSSHPKTLILKAAL